FFTGTQDENCIVGCLRRWLLSKQAKGIACIAREHADCDRVAEILTPRAGPVDFELLGLNQFKCESAGQGDLAQSSLSQTSDPCNKCSQRAAKDDGQDNNNG